MLSALTCCGSRAEKFGDSFSRVKANLRESLFSEEKWIGAGTRLETFKRLRSYM